MLIGNIFGRFKLLRHLRADCRSQFVDQNVAKELFTFKTEAVP